MNNYFKNNLFIIVWKGKSREEGEIGKSNYTRTKSLINRISIWLTNQWRAHDFARGVLLQGFTPPPPYARL